MSSTKKAPTTKKKTGIPAPRAFLQGKLTKLSAALLALVQSPNLLARVSEAAATFSEAADLPLTWTSIIAALGVIWGGIRPLLGYPKLPRLPEWLKKPLALLKVITRLRIQLKD